MAEVSFARDLGLGRFAVWDLVSVALCGARGGECL